MLKASIRARDEALQENERRRAAAPPTQVQIDEARAQARKADEACVRAKRSATRRTRIGAERTRATSQRSSTANASPRNAIRTSLRPAQQGYEQGQASRDAEVTAAKSSRDDEVKAAVDPAASSRSRSMVSGNSSRPTSGWRVRNKTPSEVGAFMGDDRLSSRIAGRFGGRSRRVSTVWCAMSGPSGRWRCGTCSSGSSTAIRTRRAGPSAWRSGADGVKRRKARGPEGREFTVVAATPVGAARAETLWRSTGRAEQRTFSGAVKPSENGHDVAVYRTANAAQARIEAGGGRVVRVRIDAELNGRLAARAER